MEAVTQEGFRDTAWVCRDGVRKAKALGELDVVKGDKKGSCRYIGSTKKARENVGHC